MIQCLENEDNGERAQSPQGDMRTRSTDSFDELGKEHETGDGRGPNAGCQLVSRLLRHPLTVKQGKNEYCVGQSPPRPRYYRRI